MTMFVCWKEYKNCIVGNQYKCEDGWIRTDLGDNLCAEHSEDAHYHFSINNDGHGIERGPLVYKIAFAPRQRQWEEEVEDPETHEKEIVIRTARFSPEEDEWLTTNYPQYRDNGAFNDKWCVASIEDIRAINTYLGDNYWL